MSLSFSELTYPPHLLPIVNKSRSTLCLLMKEKPHNITYSNQKKGLNLLRQDQKLFCSCWERASEVAIVLGPVAVYTCCFPNFERSLLVLNGAVKYWVAVPSGRIAAGWIAADGSFIFDLSKPASSPKCCRTHALYSSTRALYSVTFCPWTALS